MSGWTMSPEVLVFLMAVTFGLVALVWWSDRG